MSVPSCDSEAMVCKSVVDSGLYKIPYRFDVVYNVDGVRTCIFYSFFNINVFE